ncbi:MAG: hypothetical protein HHJ17_14595 [Rhodoferax sp.]|nr:hypothetical protein [Rhodoferax sp.]
MRRDVGGGSVKVLQRLLEQVGTHFLLLAAKLALIGLDCVLLSLDVYQYLFE